MATRITVLSNLIRAHEHAADPAASSAEIRGYASERETLAELSLLFGRSDAEMLEHLAPYVGQRARAQLLLIGLGSYARRAPRRRPRDFARS